MSTSQLIKYFIDAHAVGFQIDYSKRTVSIEVVDDKDVIYELFFSGCFRIDFKLSEVPEGDDDLDGLFHGIGTVTEGDGFNHFSVSFADRSELEIYCREFSMQQLTGSPKLIHMEEADI